MLLKEGRKENINTGGKKERENSTRIFCKLPQLFTALEIRDPIADTNIRQVFTLFFVGHAGP